MFFFLEYFCFGNKYHIISNISYNIIFQGLIAPVNAVVIKEGNTYGITALLE